MGNKTIRELTTDFGISKEAIYKKINHSLKNELKKHVFKEKNIMYVSEKGQDIILNSLKKDDIKEQVTNQNNIVSNQENTEYINELKKEIEFLKEQVTNHVKEKEQLLEINKSLVDTINITKKLETGKFIADNQQSEISIDEFKSQDKQGFFSKIFKRK